jgi:hypothetical protein
VIAYTLAASVFAIALGVAKWSAQWIDDEVHTLSPVSPLTVHVLVSRVRRGKL